MSRSSSTSSPSWPRVPLLESRHADLPLSRGPLRISGAVVGTIAGWRAFTDELGWTTVVLWSDRRGAPPELDEILETVARQTTHPYHLAAALRDRLCGDERSSDLALAIARVSPCGRLVEVLNASLPTVLHWDPQQGVSPYEPLGDRLRDLPRHALTEILRLDDGAAIVLATEGVLPREATWHELGSFTRALGLDPIGGALAQAPAPELLRLVEGSCAPNGEHPIGLVVIGVPEVPLFDA